MAGKRSARRPPEDGKTLARLRGLVRRALIEALPGDAPSEVVDGLAIAAGMLSAIAWSESDSLQALVGLRARAALAAWRAWKRARARRRGRRR